MSCCAAKKDSAKRYETSGRVKQSCTEEEEVSCIRRVRGEKRKRKRVGE
jgi:hypothetical protein